MPPKKGKKRIIRSKDKKQDGRIKKLESFVYKTIENKQIDYNQTLSVTSSGTATYPFLRLSQGVEDGGQTTAPARIGNNVTLMKQMFNMHISASEGLGADSYNNIRIIAVESVDGNVNLSLPDILKYPDYSTYNELVFCSPYTTKTATNKRYKIVFDTVVEISNVGTSNRATKLLKFGKKWKNGKLIEFNDNIFDTPTNHKMQLFMISDSVSAPHPKVVYNVRSQYKDA